MLQWGHHFAVVDTSPNGAIRSSWCAPLQWGHHFAVVDTRLGGSREAGEGVASMGPPLCSGGYMPRPESLHPRSRCFNGATTLQWWIPASLSIAFASSRSLQWGHHFAVVDTPLISQPYPTLPLQWGHHFAVVDTILEAAKNEKLVAELQWGHHFAVVDTTSYSRYACPPMSFNGATTLQWWIQALNLAHESHRQELQWGHHFAVVDTW